MAKKQRWSRQSLVPPTASPGPLDGQGGQKIKDGVSRSTARREALVGSGHRPPMGPSGPGPKVAKNKPKSRKGIVYRKSC